MPAFAIYDFTGVEPSSRFQDTAGTTDATTLVGRVRDLVGGGLDLVAPSDAQRGTAEAGRTFFDLPMDDKRLASEPVDFSGDVFVAVKFNSAGSAGAATRTLIARGADGSSNFLIGEPPGDNVYILDPAGTELTLLASNPHVLELWSGAPAQFSLNDSALADCDDDWVTGLSRLVIGGNVGQSGMSSWWGGVYRAVFWRGHPDETMRDSIQEWVDGGDNLAELLAGQPPTPKEIFRASFEDASGRDPLPTALLERTPARKLAGHNVICYMHPPMLAEKVIPVALEDYGKTVPGMMIWIKDEYDPLFSMGRWAQIQSRTFSANPLKVALTVRISDHPESFVEPT